MTDFVHLILPLPIPPFSDKRWSTGLDPANDLYGRFEGYGIPPEKNGDYAYLLHIIRSLKPNKGKGACILPHGVLFRGNAEALIRENLIRRGVIKGIIGLPANLFYGTGIPACIIVIDKENALNRKAIFMIDASKGFMRDGNKNRLRQMDIHKIVDVFTKQIEIEGYSRIVTHAEIENKHNFNLNIPRYIDSSEEEDLQDIEAHLLGDIPKHDIDSLQDYWQVFPKLKSILFEKASRSDNYLTLNIDKTAIKETIFNHPEFQSYTESMNAFFRDWKEASEKVLWELKSGFHPKELIYTLSENLLQTFEGKPLLDRYDVYQHLMDYWFEVMQDDCYLISAEGWVVKIEPILEKKTNKEGKVIKVTEKGWMCDLIPKPLVIERYFFEEQQVIEGLHAELESLEERIKEMEEEYGGEDGAFSELEKINQSEISKRLRFLKKEAGNDEEIGILEVYLDLLKTQTAQRKALKEAEIKLGNDLRDFYPTLTIEQVKELVIGDKWMRMIEKDIHTEMDRVSQRLTQRILELAERYEETLPSLTDRVAEWEKNVSEHLEKMGFTWK